MANTGPGSLFHLVGEKFAQLTGIELLHVPYKGATPAFNDLMGGQVDLMFAIFAGPVPAMVADGKFKVIGLATAQPLTKFPAIPVLAAHPKLAGFEFDSWAGVQVPRNTSDEVAQQLNKALYDVMQIPQTPGLRGVGNQVVPKPRWPTWTGSRGQRAWRDRQSINLQRSSDAAGGAAMRAYSGTRRTGRSDRRAPWDGAGPEQRQRVVGRRRLEAAAASGTNEPRVVSRGAVGT
jgi:hypothetical protein